MWRRTLLARLLWSHLLAVAVALLLAGATVLWLVARSEHGRLVARLDARAAFLASYAGELAQSTAILEGLADSVARRLPPEPGTVVRVFAPNGALLTTDQVLGTFPARATALLLDAPLPLLLLAPDDRVAVAYPIQQGATTIGVIEVSSDGTAGALLRRTLLLALLPAGLLAASGGLVLALLLARSLIRPLAALRAVASRIAAGDLQTRADAGRTDEIGDLAREVNRMAAELEARLTEVERLAMERREFYRSVSHELRTPLTAIRGVAENLEESVDAADRAALAIIQDEAARLNRLVDELVTGAERPFVPRRRQQPMDAGELLREVGALMGPRAQRAGVALHLEIDATASLNGDRDRLKQALVNLFDNALKWTPPGGAIHLKSATDVEGELVITIGDTGPGIPAALRPHIWERGARGADGGQGLGLALVQEVVTAHGGTARILDRPGTAVEIRLPGVASGAR